MSRFFSPAKSSRLTPNSDNTSIARRRNVFRWQLARSTNLILFSAVAIGNFAGVAGLPLFETNTLLAQNYKNNPDEPWNKYLENETLRLSRLTDSELASVTKENWESKKNQWRSELQDMLGLAPWPERGTLNPQITGRKQLEEIEVQNLVFEPSPGLYATANLYLPKTQAPEKGWPAVVYVCGHARADEYGRLMGNKTGYQHHGLWLAKHGYACIIVDTVQLGEFQGEHHGTFSQGRWDWVSKGYTPAGVEAWIAIRSLELLQERKDINSDAIGITGRSGGGAYSWFAAALDERFKAVVPVAGITDLQDHVVDGCIEGHCDCMFMVNKYKWDFGKLAALIAPRPLMLTNTDSDTIFPLSGVIRIHNQIHGLYKRLGAQDSYGLLIAPGPHKDVQELQVGAFKWLSKHLTGSELVINSAALKELEPAAMVAFKNELPLKENVTNLSQWFVTPHKSNSDDWKQNGSEWLGTVLEPSSPALATKPEVKSEGKTETLHWKYVSFQDENGWGRGWIEVSKISNDDKNDTSEQRIVHVGAWRGSGLNDNHLSNAATPETKTLVANWLSSGELANSLQNGGNATHYLLLPRGYDLDQQIKPLGELTHLHRRFYLLGDSLEQMQLRDEWALLSAITENKNEAEKSPVEIVGYQRSGLSAMLLSWNALQKPDWSGKLKSLRLLGVSHDPRLQVCLPGFEQSWNSQDILKAVNERLPVQSSKSTLDLDKYQAINTASYPQLASGVEVQLLGENKATISARTTRWSMANLADLSNLDQKDPVNIRDKQLPEDGVAGVSNAVPGVEAEIRFRWRKSNEKTWNSSEWIAVDPTQDYSATHTIDGMTTGGKYDYQVEARPKGGSNGTASFSGTFIAYPSQQSDAPIRIALAANPTFTHRDGPFGFDAFRTMQRRAVTHVLYHDALGFSSNFSQSNTNSQSSADDLHSKIEKQQILGLKSVIDFNRRVPQIRFENSTQNREAASEAHESNFRILNLVGEGQIWCLDDNFDRDAFLAEFSKSSAKYKVVIVPSSSAFNPLHSSLKQSNVALIALDKQTTGTLTVSSREDKSQWNKCLLSGPLSRRQATGGEIELFSTNDGVTPQAGYIEIEIPSKKAADKPNQPSDSTTKGSDQEHWIIRHVDPQGNTPTEIVLSAPSV